MKAPEEKKYVSSGVREDLDQTKLPEKSAEKNPADESEQGDKEE